MLSLSVGPPYKSPKDVPVDIDDLGHENDVWQSQIPVELFAHDNAALLSSLTIPLGAVENINVTQPLRIVKRTPAGLRKLHCTVADCSAQLPRDIKSEPVDRIVEGPNLSTKAKRVLVVQPSDLHSAASNMGTSQGASHNCESSCAVTRVIMRPWLFGLLRSLTNNGIAPLLDVFQLLM